MIKFNTLKLFFVLLIPFCFQNDYLYGAKDSNSLKIVEDSLNYYFTMLVHEQDDSRKIELNQNIVRLFNETLKDISSFNYPFNSLKNVGIINSDDGKLRIITWNLPYNDRTHKYFGFVQHKKSKRSYAYYELNDISDHIKKPDFVVLDNKNWYGALYYKIITNKTKGNVFYTLLGADLNNLLTKKKIIEILCFDKDEKLIFGKPVFKNSSKPVSRMIFEFNGQSNMTLTYDKSKEMIIFDHLSPSKPSLEGQYEFYGPDFSYDGLKFEHGIWNSYTDIDVRDINIE